MADIVIRDAVVSDVASVAALVKDIQRRTYGSLIAPDMRRSFAAHMSESGTHVWQRRIKSAAVSPAIVFRVAEREGSVVGLYRQLSTRSGCFVTNFYVSSAAQGSGIGRELFRDLAGAANGAPLSLEVVAANTHAIRFYERRGMVRSGTVSGTYYGLDKIRMTTVNTIDKDN